MLRVVLQGKFVDKVRVHVELGRVEPAPLQRPEEGHRLFRIFFIILVPYVQQFPEAEDLQEQY